MKETWTKAILVNIGNYENVRVERSFEYVSGDGDHYAAAVRYAELALANEILRLKPIKLRGEFSTIEEITERRKADVAETLGRYGLAHIAEFVV